MRPLVKAALVREYVYAYAAVCPYEGWLDSLVLPAVNTDLMEIFLAEVAQRHPKDFLAMVIDGARWHTSSQLTLPDNIGLIPLPPYSPELNPTEHVWDELREKEFHNKVFANLNVLERKLISGLAAMEKDTTKIKSLTGWPWIISLNLIAN